MALHTHEPPADRPSVTRVCAELVGLVRSPVDKNPRATALICPVAYDGLLRRIFLHRLTPSTRTSASVVAQWHSAYQSHGWDALGGWRVTGPADESVPYAYAIPKADMRRARPIVSYVHHPLRLLMQRVGRGLWAVLKHLHAVGALCSFTLFSMDRLPDVLHATAQSAVMHTPSRPEAPASDDTFLAVQTYDVASMYDALPHSVLVDAVLWLLATTQAATRRPGVAVHRRSRAAHLATGVGDPFFWVYIPWDTLSDFLIWSLSECYVRLGDTLLRQDMGVPQGAPHSPALAICMCSVLEHRALRNPGMDWHRLGIRRYMDDILLLCVVDPHAPAPDPNSIASLERRTRQLVDVYAPHLQLKAQQPLACSAALLGREAGHAPASTPNLTSHARLFLGCEVSSPLRGPALLRTATAPPDAPVPAPTATHSACAMAGVTITPLGIATCSCARALLDVTVHNRNASALRAGQTLRHMRFLPPATTLHSRTQLIGVLMSGFLRQLRLSSTPALAVASCALMVAELHTRGYSPTLLMRTMYRLITRRPHPVWAAVRVLIQRLPFPQRPVAAHIVRVRALPAPTHPSS